MRTSVVGLFVLCGNIEFERKTELLKFCATEAPPRIFIPGYKLKIFPSFNGFLSLVMI